MQQLETLCGKDHDVFRGVFVMLKVCRKSEVTFHACVTTIWHSCAGLPRGLWGSRANTKSRAHSV